MAMANSKAQCSTCNKEKSTYICTGCYKHFCFAHLTEHRQMLNKQLDEIINDHDQFQQTIIQQKQNPTNPSLIEQIDQWEISSIDKIKQTAQECRQTVIKHKNKSIDDIENKFVKLSQQLKKIHEENEFNETDLNDCQLKLKQITQELIQSSHISIQQDTQSFINKILIISSSSGMCSLGMEFKVDQTNYAVRVRWSETFDLVVNQTQTHTFLFTNRRWG